MEARLFHIFRNTPLGRESLLQSIHFCKNADASPVVYIPKFTKFLMYFENDVVQVDLDASYLSAPETAMEHAEELLKRGGFDPDFLEPKNFTASTLPDIPTHFDFMCCPRSISDLSSKIGLGYIGPRVRRIVSAAHFPVLMSSPVYKPWNSITVFFGGSDNAVKALKLGFRIQRSSGLPLYLFTQAEGKDMKEYEDVIRSRKLGDEKDRNVTKWYFFNSGTLEENLYEVPHDSLLILGSFGHGLIRDIIFGSTMEKVQSVLSNNMLIVGPRYTAGL